MRFANHRFVSSSMLAATLLGVLSLPAGAASQCKGLSANSCAADNTCAWVEGYVRKDGRSVSSHCKSRPGQKAQQGIDPKAPKVGQLR
ncbi:MAG: hypothetical protein KDI88_10695 [Gammaproteobacteria bacterium]|nr:hypothetical protein [Gammaproteobacteria bacterium]